MVIDWYMVLGLNDLFTDDQNTSGTKCSLRCPARYVAGPPLTDQPPANIMPYGWARSPEAKKIMGVSPGNSERRAFWRTSTRKMPQIHELRGVCPR
jgi:hypothetical protein